MIRKKFNSTGPRRGKKCVILWSLPQEKQAIGESINAAPIRGDVTFTRKESFLRQFCYSKN